MKKLIALILLFISFASYAQQTDASLRTQANTIRSATVAGSNTAARIGDMFLSIINNKPNYVSVINAVDGGTGTTYTATDPNVASYSTSLVIDVTFDHANIGSATLNLTGAAKTLQKFSGGSLTNLSASDISAGQTLRFRYNGTVFTLVGSPPSSGGGSSTFAGLTDGPGAFTGATLNFIRVNVGETALEYRTPTQVRTDLGLGTAALISSTAGGDLSGTLPSPTVAKINGNTVPANASGVLTNNGSGTLSWAASGGTGTVTSVASADGSVTVTNPTTAADLAVVKSPILTTGRTIGTITGDATSAGSSFNGSANNTNAITFATVNSNVGSFGTATQSPTITVNAKGLLTAVSNTTITPAVSSITGLGTGVGAAFAVNIGSAGAPLLFNGAGGTPSSLVGTNITGTGAGFTAGSVTTNANSTGAITSVGNATSLGSFTSANLLAALTNETGTAFSVFSDSPALTGNPTAPTQSAGDNSTKISSTAYADNAASTAGTGDHARFNVYTYGCAADGVKLTDGVISSGTAILTSASGPFTSSHVGKSIKVFGAGAAGVDLFTTILSFQSSTQVTLSVNASTNVNPGIVQFGTDNKSCIQSALSAASTNGGGTVYFPFTNKPYYLFGALVTSVDAINPNCQIYIPKTTFSGTLPCIKLIGENMGSVAYGGNATSEYSSGTIIESVIQGSGTAPALLGASFNSSGGGGVTNFTNTSVQIENLCFKVCSRQGTVHIAPSMTAVDFSKVSQASAYNSMAVTQSAPSTESILPTDATVAGWKTPERLNSSTVLGYWNQIGAFGFYDDFVFNDHFTGNHLHAGAAVHGFRFTTADGHGVRGVRWFCDGANFPFFFDASCQQQVDIDFTYENSEHNWYGLTTMFQCPSGGSLVKGRISYNTASTVAVSSNLTGLSFVNLRDKNEGGFLEVFNASSGFVTTGIHNLPSLRVSAAGSNYSNSFIVSPFGTGGGAADKAYFAVANTDMSTSPSNWELLQIQGLGSSGFTLNSRSNGSGTLRPLSIQMNGTRVLAVNTTNDVSIKGVSTNSSATAGDLGEHVSSLIAVGSAVSLTTATAANITSISLTAGDWDVTGIVNFSETTSTVTARIAGLSSTTATLPTDGSEGYCGVQSTVTSEINSIGLTRKRFSLASTTTIFLVGQATFSAGTCAGFGNITARRIR